MAAADAKPEQRVIWDAATLERMNLAVNQEFDAGLLRVPQERKRLRRFVEFEKRAMLAIAAHLPNLPFYEDLGKLSEIAYENVLIAIDLQNRNHEHPGGLRETVDEEALRILADALEHPDTPAELYGDLFHVLARAQMGAYTRHCEASDVFFNRPTAKILENAIVTKRRQAEWGEARYESLLRELSLSQRRKVRDRVSAFADLLACAGGVDGTESGPKPSLAHGAMEPIPERANFDPAFKLDHGYMSREETFNWRQLRPRFDGTDTSGAEVHGAVYQLYSYCCEIDVFLQFAMIIYRAPRDLPLAFYHDTTRQMWDEFRHTSMGHRVMRLNGIDPMLLIRPMRWDSWRKMSVAENYAWITQTGEACSLTGKHTQRKHFIKEKRFHEQTLIEWDISDESQHVRYGARWLKEMMRREGRQGPSKQFVIEATEKFAWLNYQHFKVLDIVPEGTPEPLPYKGCAVYEALGA